LDESVLAEFDLADSVGVPAFKVAGWRYTVKAGWTNGLAPHFRIVQSGADYTIEIRRAELSIVPAPGTPAGDRGPWRAQVEYQVRLVDASGNVLNRATGIAPAKQMFMATSDATRNSGEAVEVMCEVVSVAFFGGGPEG
jgi:hypothetical protein